MPVKPMECTLLSYLECLAAEQPNKRLLGDSRLWLTAADGVKRVRGFARQLAAFGVKPGSLVALKASRCLETALMIFALRAAGAVVVLCDPRQTPASALSACDVQIPFLFTAAPLEGGRYTVICGDKALTLDPLTAPCAGHAALPAGDARADAFVLFTSGSTGKSKAVVLSEYNLVNNLIDSAPLGYYAPDDIALGALPLMHVFGLVLLSGAAVLGYSVFFPESTEVEALLRAIEGQKITRMNGVPSLYLAMAEKSDSFDLSSLRAGFIGGGPVTPAQFIALEQSLQMTLIPVYGMTECIGVSCASYQDAQTLRASGVGPFYSMNRGHILLEDGSEAAVGQVGEICVTGPARMRGYFGQPMAEETLLHTGDLGCVDKDGVLHLSGRKKEIIIRNGNNLSPKRIEEALLSLPGVRTAIVVGLPHQRFGEAPYAMVTGRRVEVSELEPLLQKNELPLGIWQVEELPLTPSGKLDKQAVREVLLSWRNGTF